MAIYSVSPIIGDHIASLVYTEEFSAPNQFTFGRQRSEDWQPPLCKWKEKRNPHKDPVKRLEACLLIGFGVNIAITQALKGRLEALMAPYVQFLPIKVVGESEPWYILRVTNVIEGAIDTGRSTYKMRANGQKGRITSAVFASHNIPENSVFSYPESPYRLMISGEEIKSALIELAGGSLTINRAIS